MGLDCGYVVLPPIAAALYQAAGRSPLVGVAAVFAGVSAGFSANLTITAIDPMLAELTGQAARFLDSQYEVAPSCNLWFMIVSTVVLTACGWAVTAWLVEPRYANRTPEESGPPGRLDAATDSGAGADPGVSLTDSEKRGLVAAGSVLAVVLVVVLAMTHVDNAPLKGQDGPFPRWVRAIVPILFFAFVLPGLAYGIAAGQIRRDRDVAKTMARIMADMGPYIVLAFFAAQFIAYFEHSRLGQMLALTGGRWLASADLPVPLLLALFIGLIMVANLFIGSASAKYAFVAPVFVPMFMHGARISPELTQAAYRVGDSVSNIVTPLNPYLIIILVVMQKFMPRAGIGTLLALMVPYALVFAVVWTGLLILWVVAGVELGPQGPLEYVVASGA